MANNFPKVGQSVLVTRRSVINVKTGLAKLVPAKPAIYKIASVYSSGRVMTTSGDVWSVQPYGGKEAEFKTVEAVTG